MSRAIQGSRQAPAHPLIGSIGPILHRRITRTCASLSTLRNVPHRNAWPHPSPSHLAQPRQSPIAATQLLHRASPRPDQPILPTDTGQDLPLPRRSTTISPTHIDYSRAPNVPDLATLFPFLFSISIAVPLVHCHPILHPFSLSRQPPVCAHIDIAPRHPRSSQCLSGTHSHAATAPSPPTTPSTPSMSHSSPRAAMPPASSASTLSAPRPPRS